MDRPGATGRANEYAQLVAIRVPKVGATVIPGDTGRAHQSGRLIHTAMRQCRLPGSVPHWARLARIQRVQHLAVPG